MSLLSLPVLRKARKWRLPHLTLPPLFQSLRGGFMVFLVLFLILQCISAALLTRLVDRTQNNIEIRQAQNARQALLDKSRMALLTASDNSHRAGIYLLQDQQTGSVDSWRSLADTAQAALTESQALFQQWQPAEKDQALSQSFGMLVAGLKEQLQGLEKNDIDAFFMVPMQAFQQQFNDHYYQTLNEQNQTSAALSLTTLHSMDSSRTISLAISVLLLLVLLLSGWALWRVVLQPLNRASKQMSRIAIGELSASEVHQGWQPVELRVLTDSIHDMREGLRQIVTEINQLSSEVLTRIDELSHHNQASREHNLKQTAAFAHVSQRLQRVAEEVENSATFSLHARDQMVNSGQLMQDCGDRVADMEEKMREIVDASGQIASIVTLMEELSLQTRLLALNAAIESAHAGVYGRGFSVVAREIGLLSDKSGSSTRNIGALIGDTQQHIHAGFEKVQTLEKLYEEMQQAVSAAGTLMNELQQNASAQSQRVGKVAKEIATMHESVTDSDTLNQLSHAATAHLSEHAKRLSLSVSRFHL